MVLKITRKNILWDSINELEINEFDTKTMQILYIDEEGRDLGGLIKDWLTSITNAIIETGTFKIVPSGNYLTIDEKSADNEVLKFTGKVIAIAVNNNFNANIKLTLFMWKLLLNERITIEDMEEYDHYIYQSLNWISINDVTNMDETFVDQNDEELMKNGRNIKLTNENKNEYVKLMLKKKFIGNNEKLFKLFKKGFDETVDKKCIKRYNAKQLREEINGTEIIDLDDWKENTKKYYHYTNDSNEYDEDYYNEENDDIEYYIDLFFNVISNWSNEKLQKLLKFITGSSVVPIKGFEYLDGGLFNIQISNDSSRLPEAHTCFNTLVLPRNNARQLEKKLLMAIEVVDFGIS